KRACAAGFPGKGEPWRRILANGETPRRAKASGPSNSFRMTDVCTDRGSNARAEAAMMADDRSYAWGNPWFRWSIVSLAVLTVACFLVGFIVLPSAQRDFTAGGIWASICRAAGLPANWGAAVSPEDRAPSTAVVLVPA